VINDKNIVYLKAFGKRLSFLRKAKNLTQEQLAYDSNIPISQIGRIERGEINTTLNTLLKLANSLDISVSELLDF
jgi:transcriptional regulator with XRE-family HTH domain